MDIREEVKEAAKLTEYVQTFEFEYNCCYKCFIFFLCLADMIISILSLIFMKEEGIIVLIILFSIFIPFTLIVLYYYNKKIEIINNYFYFRVNLINELGITRKIIELPLNNACFILLRKDNYNNRFKLHIFNKFIKDKSLDDLKKEKKKNIAPKFHWSFDNIYHYDEHKLREMLKVSIGKEIYAGGIYGKFISEKEEILKYYNYDNFLSYYLNSRIYLYITFILILILFIFYYLVLFFGQDCYHYEKNYRGEEIKVYDLWYSLSLGLSWYVTLCLIIIQTIFFKYNKKRIDFYVNEGILFIGITSYFLKSYSKEYFYNLDDVKDFELIKKCCKNYTLNIVLKNNNIEKICDFSNEIIIDLDFLMLNIKKYLR